MESRVESHVLRASNMNAKPAMFQAGLSNKFTKRHTTNFHDTTIMAASAAKARAELKMERQASAIEKQQQKIEHEMRQIEAITEKLQRQQGREARRLHSRLVHAATRIQTAFRSHFQCEKSKRAAAAIEVQRVWRGERGRRHAKLLTAQQAVLRSNRAARVVTRHVRVLACRLALRHEMKWRQYATVAIQTAVRGHQARHRYLALRQTRRDNLRRARAATLIQAHARGLLTRLVYMDILYLVSRIQSVARGFLVRKRFRWLSALNLDAITKLQALVRGFLARRWTLPLLGRLHTQRANVAEQPIRRKPTRPRLVLVTKEEAVEKATKPAPSIARPAHSSKAQHSSYAVASMATLTAPTVSPQRTKRSYWLPSGANTSSSTRRRLPQLASKQPLPLPLETTSPLGADLKAGDSGDATLRAAHIQRMVRGHLSKRHPPPRLAPLERSTENTADENLNCSGDDEAVKRAAVERRQREDALRRKQLERKAIEKKRLENEESERKQMEREEKLARLWLKTSHRKQHELKQRRQTMEQQREDKERMEMLREERLVRLHLRRQSRLAKEATSKPLLSHDPQLAEATSASDDGEDVAPAKDKRHEDDMLTPVQRIRAHPRLRCLHKASQLFAPMPSQRRPPQRTKPSGLTLQKARELRSVYGGRGYNNQSAEGKPHDQRHSHDHSHNHDHELQAQYAAWDFHSDGVASQAELVEDEAEFDYGDEFDEVVEESKLRRLIC